MGSGGGPVQFSPDQVPRYSGSDLLKTEKVSMSNGEWDRFRGGPSTDGRGVRGQKWGNRRGRVRRDREFVNKV